MPALARAASSAFRPVIRSASLWPIRRPQIIPDQPARTNPYEEVFRLLRYCSIDDGEYYSALVRMFEQAPTYLLILPEPEKVLLMATPGCEHGFAQTSPPPCRHRQ